MGCWVRLLHAGLLHHGNHSREREQMKGIHTIKKERVSTTHTHCTHIATCRVPTDTIQTHTHTHTAYMQSLPYKIKQTTLYSIETLSRKVK